MNQEGALLNIVQIFAAVLRHAQRWKRSRQERPFWTRFEVSTLVLCFSIFSYTELDE